MERVDFDQLCKRAYSSESMLKDKDNLWLEVFKLSEWYFIARGALPEVYPYIAEANIIEPNSHWVYAFTDSNRATFYAKKNNLYMDDKTSQLISVPNDDKLIPWLENLQEEGVKGVFFNADGHGFFVPIKQLRLIREHLNQSYPAEIQNK
ncbi:MAG: hypothetical protein HUJ25_02080 [Crocinitomicaceae bacterium]|nr:hypothetical protein [Crocinitomicaceae bacterium]